jgi:collagen type VII alpha
MAINFPSSPALNDIYTLGTRQWKWNGNGWALQPLTAGFTGSIGYTGSKGDIGYTGSKGDTGLGFNIAKTYTSVANLTADTSPSGINTGEFAIIENGSLTDAENSRLYLWNGSAYSFVSDLSGTIGFTGSFGYTGSKGDQGVIGYTGSKGFTGSKGDIGYTGSKGDQGDIGYTGSKGDIGYTGSKGFTGSQGDIGYTGSKGDIGYTGSLGFTGSKGDIGYTGSKGDIGYTGSEGNLDITTSSTPPTSGVGEGDIWVDSATGVQYFYYNDGNSTQWVELSNQGVVGFTGSQGAQVDTVDSSNFSSAVTLLIKNSSGTTLKTIIGNAT